MTESVELPMQRYMFVTQPYIAYRHKEKLSPSATATGYMQLL